MHFFLVRPSDDPDIVELIAVQHPKKTPGMFIRSWDDALAAVKRANPQEWDVNHVLTILEQEEGWTIMKLDTQIVTY